MPELPEVETIKLQLQKKILAKKIQAVYVATPSIYHGDHSKLKGQQIIKVGRRGKSLLIFTKSTILAIHLKMSGQLLYFKSMNQIDKNVDRHTHVVIYFSDQSALLYKDIRKFGWVKQLSVKELENLPYFKTLGPDALEIEMHSFAKLISKSNTKIKTLLFDQHKIAGLGNIYINESLFSARISPLRKANSLSPQEIKTLHLSINQVLQKAILNQGSSKTNFRDLFNKSGKMQTLWQVYSRKSQPCFRCQSMIKRIVTNGRSTFYCPHCQI